MKNKFCEKITDEMMRCVERKKGGKNRITIYTMVRAFHGSTYTFNLSRQHSHSPCGLSAVWLCAQPNWLPFRELAGFPLAPWYMYISYISLFRGNAIKIIPLHIIGLQSRSAAYSFSIVTKMSFVKCIFVRIYLHVDPAYLNAWLFICWLSSGWLQIASHFHSNHTTQVL